MTGDVFFDAFNRGRYATDASFYQILPLGVVVPRTMDEALRALSIARDEGQNRHPARRRHLAVRPDRQRGNCRRLFQASEPHPLARRRKPHLRGRARHRARRPQPPAQKARAVVSGRRLHRLARHHRRHGRQQFLRRPFAALRHHARQHAVDGCGAGRRHALAFRRGAAGSGAGELARRAGLPCSATCSISASARPPRYRSGFQRCSAASAATISMRWCRAMRRTTWRIFWSAPRARWPSPRRSNSNCGLSSATRCWASAISAVSTRRWMRRSIW